MAWSHYREMQMSFVQRAHGMVEHNMSTHMVISCQQLHRRIRSIVEARGGNIDYYWIVEWIF